MTTPARSELLDFDLNSQPRRPFRFTSQTLIAEPDCEGCPLNGSRKVPPEGNLNADVVILGESPGEQEVNQGRPFIGPSGKLLDLFLKQVDLCEVDKIACDVFNAFSDKTVPLTRISSFVTNVIMCKPRTATIEGKGTLNPDQILKEASKHCRSRLISELKLVNPKAIIALGNASLEALTGTTGITRRRGAVHFSDEFNAWVVPTLHPAFLLRGQERQGQLVLADIKRGFKLAHEGWKDDRKVLLFNPSPSEESDRVKELILWLQYQQTRVDPLTIDVETTKHDAHNAMLKTIALASLHEDYSVALPLPWTPESNILSNEAWSLIIPELSKLLATQRPKIGHNLTAFDLPVLAKHNLPLNGPIYDTLVISHVLEPDIPHDLGSMVSYKLDVAPWKEIERVLERKKKASLSDLMFYNASDAQHTSRLFVKLMSEVYEDDNNTNKEIIEIETACSLLGAKMSYVGVPVCQKTRKKVSEELQETENRTVDLIKTKFSWPEFNPHRAINRRELLYGKLGLPVKLYTLKTSQPSTARSVILEAAASSDYVKALLDYDIAHKLRSTFVDKMAKQPDGIVHKDGRVRPSWNICGTVTARWSSSNPNLQNQPNSIRKIFRAHGGKIFVGADASQIEFRVIAALSGCKTLIDRFNAKEDVHSYVAGQIFGNAFTSLRPTNKSNKMWATLRTIAKRVSYALNYGATASTIYDNLKQDEELPIEVRGNLSVPNVSAMQYAFFKAFPEISRWRDQVWREANKNGFLVIGPLKRKRKFGYTPIEMTVAANLPIQCYVADFMNTVFLNIDKKLPPGSNIIANVHDSILVECLTHQADGVKKIVGECMSSWCEGPVGAIELPSEPMLGESWDMV